MKERELDYIKICTIEELVKIIPDIKFMSGIDYTDMKNLLVDIIYYIELNKVWEFVQFVQNKPTLYIIRKKKISYNIEDNDNIKQNVANVKNNNEYTSLNTSLPWK
ncbi:hypothetical protein M0Q50_06420 [bacterium]|jgi:hypothetical protein|nr:hypothetical protein [bacterium]